MKRGREGERERERGRNGGWESGREGEREGGREEGRKGEGKKRIRRKGREGDTVLGPGEVMPRFVPFPPMLTTDGFFPAFSFS